MNIRLDSQFKITIFRGPGPAYTNDLTQRLLKCFIVKMSVCRNNTALILQMVFHIF